MSSVHIGRLPRSSDVDLRACSAVLAVPKPEDNPVLVRDCESLLGLRDTVAGSAELKWSEDIPIGAWEGASSALPSPGDG